MGNHAAGFSYQLVDCNRKDNHDNMETLDPTRKPLAAVADGVRIHRTLLKGRDMDTLKVVEIVDETVKFYSENVDRRAVVNGTCQYTTPDGRHCAIGRCLIDESFVGNAINFDLIFGTASGGIDEHWPTEELLNAALKPQYRGLSFDFWTGLQHLHDCDKLWNSTGLTAEGKEAADELILAYA